MNCHIGNDHERTTLYRVYRGTQPKYEAVRINTLARRTLCSRVQTTCHPSTSVPSIAQMTIDYCTLEDTNNVYGRISASTGYDQERLLSDDLGFKWSVSEGIEASKITPRNMMSIRRRL